MTLREAIDETIRLCWNGTLHQPPTPSQALFVLNDALLHASFVTRYLIKTNTHSVNMNQQTIETDAVHLLRVFWNNAPLNRFVNMWAQVPDAAATQPSYYWDNQGRIILFPRPTQAGTLKTIEMGVHPTFVAADIDNPAKAIEFPSRLHRFICLYAAGSFLMAYPESIDRARAYQQEANTMFLEYRRQFEENMRSPMRSTADSLSAWAFDLTSQFKPNIQEEAIQRALDDALIALFGKYKLVEDVVSVNVPSGSRYVNLNNQSLVRVHRVYWSDDDKWRPLTSWDAHYDLLSDRNREGQPRTYVAYGNRIELYPRPNNNIELRIEGAIIPSSNPLSLVPAHLHRSIALYAAGLLLESVVTEKGVSVGMIYQQKALQEWHEWARDVNTQRLMQDDYATAVITDYAFDTYRMWRD